MPKSNNRTFVKIGNREIYDRIVSLEQKIDKVITDTKVNAAVIALIVSIVVLILSRIL